MRRSAPRVPYLAGIARLAAEPALRPPRQVFSDSAYDPSPGAPDQASRRATQPLAAPATRDGTRAPSPEGRPDAAGAAPLGSDTGGAIPAPLAAIEPDGAAPKAAGGSPATAGGSPAAIAPTEPAMAPAPPAIAPRSRAAPAAAAPAEITRPAPTSPVGPVSTWFDPRWAQAVQLPPSTSRDTVDSAARPAEPARPAPDPARALPEAGESHATLAPPVAALEPATPATETGSLRPAPVTEVTLVPAVRDQTAGDGAVGTPGQARSGGGRLVIGAIEVTVVPPPPPVPERRAPVAPPPVYVRPASLIAGSPGATQLRSGSRRWYGTAQG